jgi:leucyl-tRNA synthetase
VAQLLEPAFDNQSAPEAGADTAPETGADSAYDHRAIERRWQAAWQDAELYLTPSAPSAEDRCAYIFTEHPAAAQSAPLGLVRSYAITDSYARFMRARGASVLYSLGFQAFGLPVELEALAHDTTPAEWVKRCLERVTREFHHLGFSLDWSRASCSSDPDAYQWSQLLFLTLLEKDIVYRSEEQWYLRAGRYLQENEDRLSALSDWNELAVSSQRANQGGVDGVEFDVASLDGTTLTVFTTHADAIKQAEFIAMSPNHPDIEQWISSSELQSQTEQARAEVTEGHEHNLDEGVLVDTGRLVTGAGTDGPLRVVVSSAVDAQFGPTAMLGIPALDQADADLAKQLSPPSTEAWRITDKGPSAVRPAKRGGNRDLPISHKRGWGTPIPVIYCEACGTVPVPFEDLPVRLPESLRVHKAGNPLEQDEDFLHCRCPRCAAQARRETETLEPIFDGLWQWIAPCVKDIGAHGLFDDPELARWLPAERAVQGPDHSALMFDQRIGAKALRDCGLLSCLPEGEPFAGLTMHQGVQIGRPKEINHLEGLIRGIGADAVRLMVLYGAAPTNVLTWRGHTLQYCRNWLSSFWDYALPRLQKLAELGEIDDSEGAPILRRRLARWCGTAIERITENYDSVQMHRAARNVMALLVRIQDFEQRVIDRDGELTAADQRALAEALVTAVQLIAPLTPHIAEELWSAAGRDGFVAASAWPEPPA